MGVPSFWRGGVAASPLCSHTASLGILQDLELLSTSEETPCRSRALGTSPGSVLDEAREPGVTFQGPLCGWVGETGATALAVLWRTHRTPAIQKLLLISLPHL